MKPEDARKLADELAGRNIESVGMLSRNERDQIVTALRTLADQVEELRLALSRADDALRDIQRNAEVESDMVQEVLRQGGAQ